MKPGIAPIVAALILSLTFAAIADTHYVDLNSPSPTPPYTNWLTAATNIQDAVDAAVVGDTVLVTNGVYSTGGRAVFGLMTNRVVVNKALTVRSVNGPQATIIQGQAPGAGIAVRCVYLTNQAILNGFTLTNGFTRGGGDITKEQSGGGVWAENTNAQVQDCVIVGCWGDYFGGGAYGCFLTNSILTNNAAKNGGGAAMSVLDLCKMTANQAGFGGGGGGGAHSSLLANCLIEYNWGGGYGGGARSSTLTNCILAGNAVSTSGGAAESCNLYTCIITNNGSSEGPGGLSGGSATNCLLIDNTQGSASGVILDNCILFRNSATYDAAGATYCVLKNCTVVSNSVIGEGGFGAGVQNSILFNCIVVDNVATNMPNYSGSSFTNSCTTPLPAEGLGNISSAPAFIGIELVDLRLQSNSPCINAGNNAYVTSSTDLDGNPRIAGGTVDMGAYEFQSPSSVLSYAWAQQYGLPTDGSADFVDTDGEGANNYHEWRSDTVPTNAASALWMAGVSNAATGLNVSWQSVATRSYRLERVEAIEAVPQFQTIATNIPGVAGTKTYNDTTATNGGPYFYRVGVQ